MSQQLLSRSLGISIIVREKGLRDQFESFVSQLGHTSTGSYASEGQFTKNCLQPKFAPNLIVTDVSVPKTLTQVRDTLLEQRRVHVPILLFAARVEDCLKCKDIPEVFCHVTPVSIEQFQAAILLALDHFSRAQELSQQLADTKQQLAERKVIEQAKGIIMQHLGLSENDAHEHLQQIARSHNETLVSIAEQLVAIEKKFFTRK